MKKSFLILIAVLMSFSTHALAFTYTYEGNTLSYEILDEKTKTCSVTANTDSKNGISLAIPEIAYNGNTGYTVKTIGPRAFDMSNPNRRFFLTSIKLPESLISIGECAFACQWLTSVVIPNSVTSIGDSAFASCTDLTSVEITNSVTSIGERTFAGCSRLILLDLGNSVTSIGKYAFAGCEGVTSVVIPNSVTSIEEWTFSGCAGLTSVVIPNSVTSIGGYAFWGCAGLTSVEIPNSVTSIGDGVFLDCSSLTSVVIPNSVTSFGRQAFDSCLSLTDIYYKTNNPVKSTYYKVFARDTYNTATLYVAQGGIDKARFTYPWCEFKNIKEMDFSSIGNIVTDTAGDEIDFSEPFEVYNFQGVIVANCIDKLSGGIYIVYQGNKVKKIIVE